MILKLVAHWARVTLIVRLYICLLVFVDNTHTHANYHSLICGAALIKTWKGQGLWPSYADNTVFWGSSEALSCLDCCVHMFLDESGPMQVEAMHFPCILSPTKSHKILSGIKPSQEGTKRSQHLWMEDSHQSCGDIPEVADQRLHEPRLLAPYDHHATLRFTFPPSPHPLSLLSRVHGWDHVLEFQFCQ